MEKIRHFRQLRIWQVGMRIVKEVYALTHCFPRHERYGLSSQMQRAAVSIPTNIAEGFKRYHGKEYRQFLHIALGSAAELETLVCISTELNFATGSQAQILFEQLDYLARMISTLLKCLP